MSFFRFTSTCLLIGSTIAQATPKKEEPQPQRVAATVVASGALPGADYTATLKRRNPTPSPQQGQLTRSPAQSDVRALDGSAQQTSQQ